MPRQNEQMKKFLESTGALAESILIFFRATINAGATIEEAPRLTQIFITSMLFGKPKEDDDG